MSRLNAPRDVPYEFRVVEIEGWVWIYDDSERTYICSFVPMIWAEPIYPMDRADDGYDWPESDYWEARKVEGLHSESVDTYSVEVDREEAWDDAREEACANCRL